MDKLNWLKAGDIGYIIDTNHVEGPFIYHVIYPEEDYAGNFCLYSTAMTEIVLSGGTKIGIKNHIDDVKEECGF